MKVNSFLLVIFISVGAIGLVNAQPLILNEILQLHNAQPNYSARSTAAGGAFTALGADVVSFYKNPAGLALYRSTEVFYGPGLSFKSTNSNFANSKNNNVNFLYEGGTGGIVITSKRNHSKLKYINYGFAFHRSKNNNFTKSYKGLDEYTDDYGNDVVLELEETIETKGSRYSELAFSIAGNFNDKFLFGLNVTTPKYIFDKSIYFTERDIDNLFYVKERIFTETDKIVTETSYSLGIGFVYKINNNFRIGLSAKTPSLLFLEEDYEASLVEIDDYDYETGEPGEIGEFFYVLNTASKFDVGLSYLNQKGFVAFDVGYVINNRYQYLNEDLSVPDWTDNAEINNLMKNALNFRVGGEYIANENLRLRAGYNFNSSPLQNNDIYSGTHNISVGAGIRKAVFETETDNKTVFADATLKYSFYQSEYEIYEGIENGPFVDFNYHQLQLITTFGFKF